MSVKAEKSRELRRMRRYVAEHMLRVTDIAAEMGVVHSHVSEVLRERKAVSWKTIDRMWDAIRRVRRKKQ